jgi:hypothetical protein
LADDTNTTADGVGCDEGDWFGPDHVYAVTAAVTGSLNVILQRSYTDHLLIARAACPGNDDLDCDYGTTAAANTAIVIPAVQGNVYYVFVDSWNQTSGSYDVTFQIMP